MAKVRDKGPGQEDAHPREETVPEIVPESAPLAAGSSLHPLDWRRF